MPRIEEDREYYDDYETDQYYGNEWNDSRYNGTNNYPTSPANYNNYSGRNYISYNGQYNGYNQSGPRDWYSTRIDYDYELPNEPPPPPAPLPPQPGHGWPKTSMRPNGTGRKLPQTPRQPSTLTLQKSPIIPNGSARLVPNHVEPMSSGRKLPATPVKPSSLFSKANPINMAFQNLTDRFPKAAGSLSRFDPTEPSPSSYSYPKLNISNNRLESNTLLSKDENLTLMYFRNGFGSYRDVNRYSDDSYEGDMVDTIVSATSHQRRLPSLAAFGRSNSLGRNLPAIPSKPPTLVRRRTFEDDDYRPDWI